MDPDAPLTVTKGVVSTCLVNGFIFSAYGTLKRVNIGPLAASAALNGGIVGATFFSFREYIVSPQLLLGVNSGQFSRRRAQLEAARDGAEYKAEKLDWWDMRAHKVPDTAISGALTGGVLNARKRGRAGIVPGAVTASLLCSLLQLAYNELGVARLKYISKQLQDVEIHELPLEQSSEPPSKPITIVPPPVASSEPFSERIFGLFGFRKVSDEDYLKRLKIEREAHLQRIAELENEQQDEDRSSTS